MFNKPEIVISSILNWSFQITFKLRENLTFRCWEFNFPSLMAVSITVQSTSKADELVSRREKMTPLGKPENWLSNPCHCEQSKKLVEMSVTEMSVVFVCSVQTGDLTCPGGWPVWLLSRFTDGLWGSLSFDEENVALNWDVIVVWTPITTSTLSPILSYLSLSLSLSLCTTWSSPYSPRVSWSGSQHGMSSSSSSWSPAEGHGDVWGLCVPGDEPGATADHWQTCDTLSSADTLWTGGPSWRDRQGPLVTSPPYH